MLNDQQQAAVQAPLDQPVMVVASPGSGKTRVLTNRVAYLVAQGAVPASIVVTTFTKRAAEEMKERLYQLIGEATEALRIGTIHSVCLRILREEKLSKPLISLYDQKKIVATELNYQNLDWDVGWRYPFGWLQKAKTALIEPGQATSWFEHRLLNCGSNQWQAADLARKLQRVYQVYEREKGYLGQMDFSDMLTWVAKRLRDQPEFLRRWQSRIQFVLVDECQDTSHLSYELLRTLSEPESRFFTVGDPDQQLFRWNGADPDHNIFGFQERFPAGEILPLEINYRSTCRIVQAAQAVIQQNYEGVSQERLRFKKEMRPAPDAPEGAEIKVLSFADSEEEAAGVVELVAAQLEAQRKPQDYFLVYRVNSQSRALEDALIRAGIPYVVQGSLGFYDRKSIKDLLAYLALVADEKNDEAFQRVCNLASAKFFRPTRGFGARWIQEVTSLAQGHRESLWESMLRLQVGAKRFQREGIQDLVDLVLGVRKDCQGSPTVGVGLLRERCYDKYLLRTEGLDEELARDEGVFDDLEELVVAAANFETIGEFLAYVEEVREMQASQSKDQMKAVVLSTIHRVKGLERPVVIGVGLSEGILPHKYALQAGGVDVDSGLPIENLSGLADERCAAFVLVSRAQEELYLSYLLTYRNKDVAPSRFLTEMGLLEDLSELTDVPQAASG